MATASENLIAEWRSEVEQGLLTVAKESAPQSSMLSQALEYVLLSGGKRLRALVALALEHDLTKNRSRRLRTLSSAVAIEALHAASLVHDDLPALDNDDMRRGKPSCHRAFGEAMAILVGDALVGSALYHVASDEELSTDTRARLGKMLSKVWLDLCVGQQLDISQAGSATTEDRAIMIRLKTGVLFGSAVACGAICGGIAEAAIDHYFDWGVRVGECFQALDDLDDGDSPEKERATLMKRCVAVVDDVRSILQLDDSAMTARVARMICGLPAR